MRRSVLVVSLLLLVARAGAGAGPRVELFVVAGAAGGDGTRQAPYGRIADALDAGRSLAATHEVVIDVAPGTYDSEPQPLVVDYPVRIKGSTVLVRDGDGVATGEVRDAATVRHAAAGVTAILVTGDGVRIRGLAVDAGGSTNALAVDKATDFVVGGVHVSNATVGFAVSASSGTIRDGFAGPPLGSAAVLSGGNDEHPADVRFVNNRLLDYTFGAVALQGAADPLLPREPFHTLTVKVDGNVMTTNVELTPEEGPSNPYGVRLNLVNAPQTPAESTGTIIAKITDNFVAGTHRYPLLVTGGQTRRLADRDWSGVLDLRFEDNEWLAGEGTESSVIITFTNARMGIAPFWDELAFAQEYLEGATFRIRHDGELDACHGPFSSACHVDHPEIEPCDGRVLGNRLVIDGDELPHGTFIPDVCP